MELKIPDKQFVCIDYPCVVNNVSKVLNTLGGEKGVTRTYLDPTRRLELHFRPQDVYCKPACADRKEFSGLLLKVRKRRRTALIEQSKTLEQEVPPRSENATKTQPILKKDITEVEGEILGIINTVYTFNSMTDYQYLPMTRTVAGGYESLVDQLVIDRLLPRSWLDEPACLHMPPPIFTRYGRPVPYCYREPPNPRDGAPLTSLSSNIIGVARRRRPRFTAFFQYAHKTVPEEPYPQSVSKLTQHKIRTASVEEVKKMFEHRPIWTRSALRGHLPHLTRDELQYILPTISYYCQDGPWRTMWVRFGYDMRKDPASKIFQNLDFRLRRTTPGVSSIVPAKRSTYEYYLPNTVTKVYSQTSVIQKESFQTVNQDDLKTLPDQNAEQEALKATYKFSPNIIPPFRQMFYHLCDVDEPEVQRLVHSNDGLEVECTERDGWCLPETVDKCRAILFQHFQRAFAERTAGVVAGNQSAPQMSADETGQTRLKSETGHGTLEATSYISSSEHEEEEAGEEEEDEEEEDDDEVDDDEGDGGTADENSG